MHRSRLIVALAAAVLAVAAFASPAEAATYTKPVTLTATSSCVYGTWMVTTTVTSTQARTVDLWGSSDYGNRPAIDPSGVPQLRIALQPGVPYRVVILVGASAQYVELGVFPAGSGGWDGWANPLAWRFLRDPIWTNPYAGC